MAGRADRPGSRYDGAVTLVRMLDELDENPAGGGGVQEGDEVSSRTGPGLSIDEPDARLVEPLELGAQVVDSKGDVVKAGAPIVEILDIDPKLLDRLRAERAAVARRSRKRPTVVSADRGSRSSMDPTKATRTP